MQSYNIADAKAHLSEILQRVAEGEEIVLTRRGRPIARLVPADATGTNILGAGIHDSGINFDVLARDDWWKPLTGEEADAWYE